MAQRWLRFFVKPLTQRMATAISVKLTLANKKRRHKKTVIKITYDNPLSHCKKKNCEKRKQGFTFGFTMLNNQHANS